MHKLNLSLTKVKTKSEKYDIYTEFKQMRKELRQLESDQINQVLANADVICCTLTSAGDKTLRKYIHTKLQDQLFDVLVIDECAQSIEPACWIAI